MQHHYRRTDHSVYLCDYHLVLPTKYRKKIFDEALFGYVHERLMEIVAHYPRIFIKTVNHDEDHIHLLLSIPPQVSVGSVVRLIKSNTSRGIKNRFPRLKKIYWGTDGIWSEGYFVSTVGADAAMIARYIELQGAEDEGQTATLFG
jgi:putative transposase